MDVELIERTRDILRETTLAHQNREDPQEGSESGYEAFRSADSLTNPALQLYLHTGTSPGVNLPHKISKTNKSKAKVAGLDLNTLARAVYMLEQRIMTWQKEQAQSSPIVAEDP